MGGMTRTSVFKELKAKRLAQVPGRDTWFVIFHGPFGFITRKDCSGIDIVVPTISGHKVRAGYAHAHYPYGAVKTSQLVMPGAASSDGDVLPKKSNFIRFDSIGGPTKSPRMIITVPWPSEEIVPLEEVDVKKAKVNFAGSDSTVTNTLSKMPEALCLIYHGITGQPTLSNHGWRQNDWYQNELHFALTRKMTNMGNSHTHEMQAFSALADVLGKKITIKLPARKIATTSTKCPNGVDPCHVGSDVGNHILGVTTSISFNIFNGPGVDCTAPPAGGQGS